MKKIHLLLLSILSGILLWLSWTPAGFPFISFIAFVPLLFVSQHLKEKNVRFPFWQGMKYAYIAFLIWNVATTWWIWNITPEGSIATFVLNTLFMSMVFGAWQRFRTMDIPESASALAFVAFWCSWEFLHLNWDITWPWLHLGNVFATCTEYVQWYEITGAFGGTLWILISNFLIFYILKNIKENRKKSWIFSGVVIAWIAIPMVGSIIRYSTYTLPQADAKNSLEAVIVQQNTDPVDEQYRMSNLSHARRILSVAETKITDKTQLVVCAETAIPWSVEYNAVTTKQYPVFDDGFMPETYSGLQKIDSFVGVHKNLNMIVGLSTERFYDHKATLTAHKIGKRTIYVDSYNTAVCYNQKGSKQTYHKSKLVPGVEKMPYPKVLGFLEELAIDLGGTSGSLATDTLQRAFTLTGTDIKIGTPICYESAYGEHFGKFIKNGAQLMCVITNDGWWDDSPGHKQHFLMSKLRAVESRRTILRAANTGISAFIDERGDSHQQTKYNTRTAIRQTVCSNDVLTFYVKHGDYIARIAVIITLLLILYKIYWRIRVNRLRKQSPQSNEL